MAFGAANGTADSLLNQAIDGKFSLGQTLFDGFIGAATAGLLHGAGKIISNVSPYVTKSISKVLGKLSEGTKPLLSKISGKVDDVLRAFDTTSRELFEKVAGKANNVVNSIKSSVEDFIDRVSNRFNEVTTKIDDLLYKGASKADDALNAINEARYNIRKAIGLEEEYAVAGGGYVNNAPEETSFFKDKITKMTGSGDGNIEKVGSNDIDISDNFDLEAAEEYERKIDNSKYFYHDEGDFGEEVTGIVANGNSLGDDVSPMFQSGRNGIDRAFLSEGPPPKLTMIESKASKKGKFSYSDEQKLGGKKYFENMINDGDGRYDNFEENLEELRKRYPGLQVDYIRVETKIKITDIGFGVDDLSVKDWNGKID